jgi:hypothetical protein
LACAPTWVVAGVLLSPLNAAVVAVVTDGLEIEGTVPLIVDPF